MGRTKHWRTGRGAPDRPDGSKYQCCERQYRTARHRPDLAPSAPDRILQGPTTWTRKYSSSLPGLMPFGDGVRFWPAIATTFRYISRQLLGRCSQILATKSIACWSRVRG